MNINTLCLATALTMTLGLGQAQAQSNPDGEDNEPVSSTQSPTMSFVGERYRVGVGIDTEFDVIGEFLLSLTEDERSAWLAEGWLGGDGAGGVKLNYHWVFGGESAEGLDGEVYTDGRIAKLFIAADQNQRDDRKLTFGGGYEYQDWFFSGYGMTALTDERRVNQFVEFEDLLVEGLIDGRGFTRIDTLQRVTDLFEAPYEWGAGLRAGRYFDGRLLRLRGGLDYEDGDFGTSQMTASVNLDKFFAHTPHGLSLRTGFAHKRGDFEEDRNDFRASLVYSYSFGQRHRPREEFRQEEVQVQPEPRFEERAVASEVTLSDRATFALDSAELRPAATETLDEVLDAILDGRLVGAIQVAGHTCNLGTESYNQSLSERRAQSVVDYLIARGLDRDQIVARGYGELEPRFSNDTEESRARNRRVEISFVTEQSRTERIRVSPEGPATEIRQVQVPVEAPWIRRALRNPVQHKRIVDYYRYEEVSETVTQGEVVFDNTAPAAADDQFALVLNSVDNVLDVLANDTDADGDSINLVAVGAPANGQVEISGSVLVYTPANGFIGSDTFSYTVEDGFGGQAQANVSILVSDPNNPPVAGDDSATTQAGQPVTIAVLDNDSDADGDALDIASFNQPTNGSVSQEGTALTYTPNEGFVGMDSFTYLVSDGRGGEAAGQVRLTVEEINNPPVAGDDSATTQAGQPVTIAVLDNDSDADGDALDIASFNQPANGSVSQEGTALTYTPKEGFVGMDSFTYLVSDGRGGEAAGQVRLTVEEINNPPVAGDDSATTQAGQPVTIAVLDNDSDADGDALDIASFNQPANGSVSQEGTALTYTPNEGFVGMDSFTYLVSDGRGGEAAGQVRLTVEEINNPPVAGDDSATTQAGQPVTIAVLDNDSDADGDALDIASFNQPTNGSVSQEGTALTYTPKEGFVGMDSFTYLVSDGRGGEAAGQVRLTVEEINNPPVAGDDSATTQAGQPVTIAVLDNDSDADGDALDIASFNQPANGSVSQEGTALTYTPNEGFVGMDSFTYLVSDGRGGEAAGQVNITVSEPVQNRPPVANPDAASGPPNEIIIVDVLANDFDPDGDPLTVISVTQISAAPSTITINADGTIGFEISATCNGRNYYRYTIADPSGETSSALVDVTRTAPEGDASGTAANADLDCTI